MRLMGHGVTISRISGFERGKAYEFKQGPLTLGTDPTCEVAFDATWDKTVSRCHAVLDELDGCWWIADQSKDGVWIDGRKVSRHKLASGDVIELGRGGPKVKIEWGGPPAVLPPIPSAPVAKPVSAARPIVTPANKRPVVTPVVHPAPTSVPAPKHSPWPWLVLAVLLLLGAGFLWLLLSRQHTATEDEQLAQAAQRLEPCVGLVVLVVSTPDGERSEPIATAWAIGTHTFATNGHVAQPVKDALAKGATAFIIIDKNPDQRYKITNAEPHPRFGQKIVDGEGKDPAVPPYDVGILTVAETLPVQAPLASTDELARLDSGERIAYLGFPMEGLAGGGVDFRNPVATMQSGIVTSVTDYWLSKADADKRLLIQHNLGATGGASGSPVFNTRGEVIGILCAGNIIGQIDVNTGQETRAPSGVMINFAQRVDVLNGLLQNHGNAP